MGLKNLYIHRFGKFIGSSVHVFPNTSVCVLVVLCLKNLSQAVCSAFFRWYKNPTRMFSIVLHILEDTNSLDYLFFWSMIKKNALKHMHAYTPTDWNIAQTGMWRQKLSALDRVESQSK